MIKKASCLFTTSLIAVIFNTTVLAENQLHPET